MRKTLLIFVAIFVGAALVSGNTTNSSLTGVVLNSKHQPILAHVYIQSADGSAPRILRTDTHGKFHTILYHPGLFDLRAEAGGLSSDWSHNVVVRAGKEVDVTLILDRPVPPHAPR